MKKQISLIADKGKKYNLDLQPGSSKKESDKLMYLSLELFNYSLPKEYTDFLNLSDGMFSNGIEIYSSHNKPSVNKAAIIIEGFIEANEIWRDDEDKNNTYFLPKVEMRYMPIMLQRMFINVLIG